MIKKNIPNLLTCGNLFCGVAGIVFLFQGQMKEAGYMIGAALLLDFFDGFVARLLKVASPIGKDLDSLADMVTFGALPGLFMFKMIGISEALRINLDPATSFATIVSPWQWFGLLIAVFSGIRLARFNNDTRQSESFIGLPTPANTMLIVSIPLTGQFGTMPEIIRTFLNSTPALIGFTMLSCWLLIAGLPLIALKFKKFGWKGNQYRYLLLLGSAMLVALSGFSAVPLIILLYLTLSLVNNIFSRKQVKV